MNNESGGTCPKCKQRKLRRLNAHIAACQRLPSAQEISDELEDLNVTFSHIAKRNHTNNDWLKHILINGDVGWTAEKVHERASGKCPICGLKLIQKRASHMAGCLTLPPAEEIDRRMREDELTSTSSLVEEYNTYPERIVNILIKSCGWTREEIAKKGYSAKVAKHKIQRRTLKRKISESRLSPQCVCGILVENKGDRCEFCVLEHNGIKSYQDLCHL
jgi:ssDNA-binding Zn-finger/Zn-ribbon topoisomerase 1